MANIDDIAKEAGVSKSTVSKVINDYEGINEETRELVFDVMRKNNYWPNATARGLSTSKSFTIGLFNGTSLNDLFFREVMEGVEDILGQKGYDLLYYVRAVNTDNASSVKLDSGRPEHGKQDLTNKKEEIMKWGFVEKSTDRNIDGVILLGFLEEKLNRFTDLLESEIPTVFVDLDLEGNKTSFVMSDNKQGIKKAVDYLCELGHKKISLIDGKQISKPAAIRNNVFKKYLRQQRLPVRKEWIFQKEYEEEEGRTAARTILDMDEKPTAIIAQDRMAIGAFNEFKDKGLSVPEDFSLIAYDDQEISRHYGLTAIRQDKFAMGKAAAELLLDMISHKKVKPVYMETQLIVRDSCTAVNTGR